MHVYLRDETITLRMRPVEADGLVPEDTDLVPMAFFVDENQNPSFRSLLPPETVEVLQQALREPVTLGLLAEEPEEGGEVQGMVGIAVPLGDLDAAQAEQPAEGGDEPWKQSVGDPDAWRGDAWQEVERPDEMPRTALLAFAPLIRLRRRFPADFGEELADLLESALAGSTRPALEARVDQMLDDL